jgi:hypothetical protein
MLSSLKKKFPTVRDKVSGTNLFPTVPDTGHFVPDKKILMQ